MTLFGWDYPRPRCDRAPLLVVHMLSHKRRFSIRRLNMCLTIFVRWLKSIALWRWTCAGHGTTRQTRSGTGLIRELRELDASEPPPRNWISAPDATAPERSEIALRPSKFRRNRCECSSASTNAGALAVGKPLICSTRAMCCYRGSARDLACAINMVDRLRLESSSVHRHAHGKEHFYKMQTDLSQTTRTNMASIARKLPAGNVRFSVRAERGYDGCGAPRMQRTVSRAITSSSFVGMTQACSFDPSVLMRPSRPILCWF